MFILIISIQRGIRSQCKDSIYYYYYYCCAYSNEHEWGEWNERKEKHSVMAVAIKYPKNKTNTSQT